MIRVLVWNENLHEETSESIRAIYPKGIHGAIAEFLACDDIQVKTATLQDEHCGITEEVLNQTDVLIFWAHMAHDKLSDEAVDLITKAVLSGMGIIFLHSAHHSKPFRKLLGTSCNLTWRESGDREVLWVTEPGHPITQGIDRFIVLPKEETYGEPFVIPTPDKILFLGNFSGGEAFRAGCLFERGNGKIFYFQPGHESNPTFYIPQVQTVIRNAVRFLSPAVRMDVACPHVGHYTDEKYVK